jgi:hypothetical protein
MTFTLGSLFGQDVIPERLAMLIATFTGFFKPLGRTTTGFHFGHFHTPHSKLSLMVSPLQTNNGTARGKKRNGKSYLSLFQILRLRSGHGQGEMSFSRLS